MLQHSICQDGMDAVGTVGRARPNGEVVSPPTLCVRQLTNQVQRSVTKIGWPLFLV
jgi:hypothetical protein